jgi:predicted permease
MATTIPEKSQIEGIVVVLVVCTFMAVVAVGLIMAFLQLKMDGWQTVALFSSGFISGVLSAYGLFKVQSQG